MTIRLSLPIVFLLATLAACSADVEQPLPRAPADLVTVLKTRPSLTRFTEALETTGVASALLSSGAYTIFAPIDKAVNAPLDETTVRHHVLPIKVTFSQIAGESTSYETLAGDEIEIDVTGQIAIGSGLMVESDIRATNGVIHVIDRVQVAELPADDQATGQTIDTQPITSIVIPAAPETGAN